MKRRLFTSNDVNKIGYSFSNLSFTNVVLREKDITDEFYFEDCISSDDSEQCISFVDPIRILFSQKSLENRLGRGGLDALIDYFSAQPNDPLSNVRSKLSDSDLKMLIKSRHIQQPSELLAWARECDSDLSYFNSEIERLKPSESTDTSESPTTNT